MKKTFILTEVNTISQPTSEMFRFGIHQGTVPYKLNQNLTELEFLYFSDGYPRPQIVSSDYLTVAMDTFVGEGNAPLVDAEIDPAIPSSAKYTYSQLTTALPKENNTSTYIYLLEEFDRTGNLICSRPQGQVGACYANATTNYSLVSLALSQLPKASNNTSEETKAAIEYAYSLQWSRPVLQYGNQLTHFGIHKKNSLLQQGGDFWTSVLGSKDFLVPEDLITQPVLYCYTDATNQIQNPLFTIQTKTLATQVPVETFLNFYNKSFFQEEFIVTRISTTLTLEEEFEGTSLELNLVISSKSKKSLLATSTLNIFPKKATSRIISFTLDTPLSFTYNSSNQESQLNREAFQDDLSIEISTPSENTLKIENLNLKYVLPNSIKLNADLNDLLLETWAKKLGLNMQQATMAFNTDFYELDSMKMNYIKITDQTNTLELIRSSLTKGNAVPVAIHVYNNYMYSLNGIVPFAAKKPTSLGGHLNLIVGMADKSNPESEKIFTYWGKNTNTPKNQWPEAILFFMNSWGIGPFQNKIPTANNIIGPIGTSPYWVEEGADENKWISSNIYWMPSNSITDGTVAGLTFVDWPKMRAENPSNSYNQPLLSK